MPESTPDIREFFPEVAVVYSQDYDKGFGVASVTVFDENFDRIDHSGKVSDLCGSACEIPNGEPIWRRTDTNHICNIFLPHEIYYAPIKKY